ncbi:protein MNN4-like [Cucumis melo var. makuwa]|uniref:Protein MNN4-like n=1 Tax=Cucumis melo var. makuwa TaxID=1194695 RepID=A0A5D3CVF0_CUCMM|nr:protein MNN4-like [Cucumis melo var. makuwa]
MTSLGKKTQEKTKKVKSRLLKLKVKAQGVKALVEEKEEAKKKGREELLSKVEKVVHSAKKDKGKEKTQEEHCEEFEKEIENLCPLEKEAPRPKKKRKVTMKKKTLKMQFENRQAEKVKKNLKITKGKRERKVTQKDHSPLPKWKRFFQWVTAIRPEVVKMFMWVTTIGPDARRCS